MLSKTLLSIAVTAAIAIPGFAAAQTTLDHPGVISIDWSRYLGGAKPTATVHISPTMLKFMSSMLSSAASEAGEIEGVEEIVSQVRLVHIEVYNVDQDTLGSAFEEEVLKLTTAGWESLVRAREDAESVNIMMLPKEDQIAGVAVLAMEEEELVVVNIAGDFNPKTLGEHFGAILRQVQEGEVDLEALLGEALLADLIEEDWDDDDEDWEEDDD